MEANYWRVSIGEIQVGPTRFVCFHLRNILQKNRWIELHPWTVEEDLTKLHCYVLIKPEEEWYMAVLPRLRAVLRHAAMRSSWIKPLAVVYWPYITNPEVPYCYYKLVTNVIRAVKIHFVIHVLYGLIYHSFQPISIQGSNRPVYN